MDPRHLDPSVEGNRVHPLAEKGKLMWHTFEMMWYGFCFVWGALIAFEIYDAMWWIILQEGWR